MLEPWSWLLLLVVWWTFSLLHLEAIKFLIFRAGNKTYNKGTGYGDVFFWAKNNKFSSILKILESSSESAVLPNGFWRQRISHTPNSQRGYVRDLDCRTDTLTAGKKLKSSNERCVYYYYRIVKRSQEAWVDLRIYQKTTTAKRGNPFKVKKE